MKQRDKHSPKKESQLSLGFSESPALCREETVARIEPAKVHSIENARKRKERSMLIKQVNRSGIFG